jgi:small subunit ribosomal protein S6
MADKSKLNQYEAMFLFGPVAANDPEVGINMARQMIERHGGQIIVIKKWDERRLAYEVDGQKRGTFVIAFYRGPGASVGAIERDVRLSEDVLRVMVLRADHLNEEEMNAVEPQPVQREEPRPEGGFGGRGFDRGPREDRGYDRGPREDRGFDRGPREERPPRPRREEPAEEPATASE